MDNELQKMHSIIPLVENVIGYRNKQVFRKIYKETHMRELKNTVAVEIQLTQRELKMPDESLVPPLSVASNEHPEKVNELLEHYESLKEGLALL